MGEQIMSITKELYLGRVLFYDYNGWSILKWVIKSIKHHHSDDDILVINCVACEAGKNTSEIFYNKENNKFYQSYGERDGREIIVDLDENI